MALSPVFAFDHSAHLPIASRRLEEGGRGVASDDLTEWSGIAANVGERNLATLFHELLKIVLIVVHSLSPQRYFSHVVVDGLNAHWYRYRMLTHSAPLGPARTFATRVELI
jgi:hypothetical protein